MEAGAQRRVEEVGKKGEEVAKGEGGEGEGEGTWREEKGEGEGAMRWGWEGEGSRGGTEASLVVGLKRDRIGECKQVNY